MVTEMGPAAQSAVPKFAEISGVAVVTFQADVLRAERVREQVEALLRAAGTPATAADFQQATGLNDRRQFLRACLQLLVERGRLKRTMPDKPRSRLQRDRIMEAGRWVVESHASNAEAT